MEISTIIFLVILAVFVIAVIVTFNKIVKALNENIGAFSNVDVALKKRYDLIPNLVSTIEEYTNHEDKVFTEVTELREKLKERLPVSKRQKLEDKLSEVMKNVFIEVENYPEIKAGENFLALQKGLEEVEKDIEDARKHYNEATRNYNILIQTFPNNVLAKLFGFKQAEYFEVDFITRENVNVDFNSDEKNEVFCRLSSVGDFLGNESLVVRLIFPSTFFEEKDAAFLSKFFNETVPQNPREVYDSAAILHFAGHKPWTPWFSHSYLKPLWYRYAATVAEKYQMTF